MVEKIKYGEIAAERVKLLMKYSLDKTLSENTKKVTLLNEVSGPIAEAIKTVESMGFTSNNIGTTYADCKSGNQVFAKAALYGLKKITDTQINRTAIGNYDCLTVKVSSIDGNAPKPYTIKNFSTNSGIKQKLNGKVAELISNQISTESNLSVGSVFFLQSFYFEWPKIINDYKESFKKNKDSYNSPLFPDGWLSFFNYWYGTSMFDEALNSVRGSEKFRCSGGKLVINTTYGDPWQEQNFKDAVSVLHGILPLASFLISVMFPPTWLALGAAALLELGDAALYYTVDKDPYAAGLSAIFAFIPFAQLKFLPFVYRLGKTKIANLIQKLLYREGSLLDEELEALKEISKNLNRLEKMSKINMAQKLTLLTLRKLKTAKDFLKWVTKLIDKRLLNPDSLAQTGLLIGGSFYTWDKIAAINGICNPAPLSNLQQSDWKIIKGIGYAGEFLQSNSTPCDLIEAQKLLEKHNNLNIIIAMLQKEVNSGTVFNQNYDNVYSLPVSFIQEVLKAGGFDKNLPKPMWTFNNKKLSVKDGSMIKKIKVFAVTGTLKKEYNNTDKKSNFTFDISGLSDAVYIVSFLNYDGTSDISKIFYLTGNQWKSFPQFSNLGNMKEGYYDKRTELSVSNYQKKKGLGVDGLAGKNTIESIISDYKSGKYGLNKEELNTWDLDKEKVDLIQKEFEDWKSDVESKAKSGQVSMEKVEQAYKEDAENKSKTEKIIEKSLNSAAVDSLGTQEFKNYFNFK